MKITDVKCAMIGGHPVARIPTDEGISGFQQGEHFKPFVLHFREAATMPQNYIAFELPTGRTDWRFDIVDGLPDPLVRNGMIEVWDRPGMGVEPNPERTQPCLGEEDKDFFA